MRPLSAATVGMPPLISANFGPVAEQPTSINTAISKPAFLIIFISLPFYCRNKCRQLSNRRSVIGTIDSVHPIVERGNETLPTVRLLPCVHGQYALTLAAEQT